MLRKAEKRIKYGCDNDCIENTKRREIMIKKQYKLAWDFIKERLTKTFVIFLIIYLVLWLGIGGVISAVFPSLSTMMEANGTAPDAANSFQSGIGSIGTWYGFLWHNGFLAFLVMILGFIPFVPISLIITIYDGALWGVTVGFSALQYDASMFHVIMYGMLAHTIFELPANLLGDSIGFTLWRTVTKRILKKTEEPIKPLFINCLRVFILFVIPLLLIAGIIEAEVSPMILQYL